MSRSGVKVTRQKGRLNYVEPTNISQNNEGSYTDKINFPYEDYNIAVDLTIKQANRYACGFWLESGESKETTFSSSNGTLSFLGGTKYGSDNFLTTNFTDITTVEPEKNTSECLGITSISIAYNSWLYPQVTIKFVDVRGSTVMQPAEKNYYKEVDNGGAPTFYKALFSFPPPTFVLKVKGFYGKAVTYNLKLNTADYDFDSNTGNFNITANFIGEIHGVYANMPLTYVACAPFMTRGQKYWKERVDKKEFVFRDKDGEIGEPMITIPELRYKLAKVAESQEVYSAAVEGEQIINSFEEQTNSLKTLEETFPFNSWHNEKNVPYVYKCFPSYKEADEFINTLSGYVETVIGYDNSYKTNYQETMKPIIECLKKNEEKTIEESFVAVEYVTFNDGGKTSYSVNSKTNENYKKCVVPYEGVKDYIDKNRNSLTTFKVLCFEKKGTIFDGDVFKKQVNTEIESINNTKNNREKQIEENKGAIVEKVLGFRPSIRNMYELMFAHMDTFMYCFYESMKTIKSQLEEHKRTKAEHDVAEGLSDIEKESVSEIGKYLPPFAAYYDPDNDKGTVLKWAEELKDGSNLEEVKFVYELLEGAKMFYEKEEEVNESIAALSKTNETNGSVVGDGKSPNVSVSSFIPITTYDFVNKDKMSNPYTSLASKIQNEVNLEGELITLFVHRLFYFASTQEKTTKENCGAFGKIEAINLFKAVKDNYNDKFIEIIKKYAIGGSEAKENKESILTNITGNTDNEISKLWTTEAVNLNKKLFKIENGDLVYDYHKGFSFGKSEMDSNGVTLGTGAYTVIPDKKYIMFPLYFQNFSDVQNYYSQGKDMLSNNEMICTEFDSTIYGGSSNVETFTLFENRDYIKNISSSLESEIKKTEEEISKTNKDYGERKSNEYTVNDGKALLKAYDKSIKDDKWKSTYLPKCFCDENEVQKTDATDLTKKITESNGGEIDKIYIKFPSVDITFSNATFVQMDSIFTNPVYKMQTSLEAKAYLFLQSIPIYSKECGIEETNKNGLALKAKLLREGSYYWREDNMDKVKFGDYRVPAKDETLLTEFKSGFVDFFLGTNVTEGLKLLGKSDKNKTYTKWVKPDGCSASRRRVLKKYFEEWATNIDGMGFAGNEDLLSKPDLYSRDPKQGVDIKSDPAKLRKELASGKKKEKDVFGEERKFRNGLDISYRANKEITKGGGQARSLQKFLRDLFFTVCTTFELFDGYNTVKKTKLKCSKDALDYGLTGFMKELNAIYGQTATDLKTNKEEFDKKVAAAEAKDPLNNKDLKLSTYMTLKNLYDKYLSCPAKGPTKTWLYNGGEEKSDFENFYYVDNFYNDIGFKLLTNASNVSSWLSSAMASSDDNSTNTLGSYVGKTMLNYLENIAENCGGTLHFLPQKFGLYSIDDTVDMFTPFNTNTNIFEDSSSCIFIYSYKMSEHLGSSDNNEDLNGYNREGDGVDLTNDEDVDKILKGGNRGYNIPSFGVTFAKQNQSIFKNIQLTSKNKGETEVSIAAQMNIAAQGSKGPRESKLYGQDLYRVYSNMSFKCGVETMGNAQIMPLMYFQLNNIPFWKGAYIVHRVTHDITAGNMTTNFEGVRINRNTIPLTEGTVAFGNNETNEPAAPSNGTTTGTTSNGGGSYSVGGLGSPRNGSNCYDYIGNPNATLSFTPDFTESNISEIKPIIYIAASHSLGRKVPEHKCSMKWVDRIIEILKTYKFKDGTSYALNIQRGLKSEQSYTGSEVKQLIKKYGSKKVIMLVPHWNGGAGKYFSAIKGGTQDETRNDSLKLLNCMVESAKEVMTTETKYFTKMPDGMTKDGCKVCKFPDRPDEKPPTFWSTDPATRQSCACALTENWFADYPSGCAHNDDNKYKETNAEGKYKTGRGWLEDSSQGLEAIAQLNARGIRKYIQTLEKEGPVGGGKGDKAQSTSSSSSNVKLDPNVDYEAKMKEKGLVNIMDLPGSEGIIVNLKYATTDNVAKKNVYGKLKNAYFTEAFAKKVIEAHKKLRYSSIDGKMCGGIMIYDAARPNSVQEYMYSVAPGVFAKPYKAGTSQKGSLHSYGTAVDLTIYDGTTKTPFDMGAGFDTNSEQSRSRKKGEGYNLKTIEAYSKEQFATQPDVIARRKFFYEKMDAAGLQVISNEWWHFQEKAENNDYGRNNGKLLDF